MFRYKSISRSGVVDNVLSVSNGIEAWTLRFKTNVSLNDQQREQLFEQIDSWETFLSEAIANIGSFHRQTAVEESLP